jgi:hypothetical protein
MAGHSQLHIFDRRLQLSPLVRPVASLASPVLKDQQCLGSRHGTNFPSSARFLCMEAQLPQLRRLTQSMDLSLRFSSCAVKTV